MKFNDLLENKEFKDLIGKFFSASSKQNDNRGQDMRLELELWPDEALQGTLKTINVSHSVPCAECFQNGKCSPSCAHCAGAATTKAMRVIEIKIPAGVQDGISLRLAGQGETGDPPGDLYCVIRIRKRRVWFGRLWARLFGR